MDSYVCAKCGGLVSTARREIHDASWCAGVQLDDESCSEDDRHDESELIGDPRTLFSALVEKEVTVHLGSRPSWEFSFHQTDIFGPADTGGALWYIDRVVSEYLAAGGLDQAAAAASASFAASLPPKDVADVARGFGFHPAPRSLEQNVEAAPRGIALALGCGGVPLSALVAAGLGWDVVMTDIGDILVQTQQNVDGNLEAVHRARHLSESPSFELPRVAVQELWFGNEDQLDAALDVHRKDSEQVGAERPLVILCSDCIWKAELHAPLIRTLASAMIKASAGLSAVGPSALVSYQRRDDKNEARFFSDLSQEAPFVEIEQMDLSSVLPLVQWPKQVHDSIAKGHDLAATFLVYRLTVRAGSCLDAR